MKRSKLCFAAAVLLIASMALGACAPAAMPTTEAPAPAPAQPTAMVEQPTAAPAAPAATEAPTPVVFAIEHFSVIAGSTWAGAQDRAMKRIEAKYPNVNYVYRENVAPDQTDPSPKT